MKRLAAVTTVLLATVCTAQSADLGPHIYNKAPPIVAPAVNWSGFYIGAHVGGAWANTDITDVSGAASVPGALTRIKPEGVFGGGQIGYNWQVGAFVVGVEADGGYLGLQKTEPLTGSTMTFVGTQGRAYGDITGRLGVSFDRALLYVKGGYAIAENPSSFSTPIPLASINRPSSVDGYVVGAGLEYLLSPNWSAKVEYLRFDFGHQLDYTVSVIAPGPTVSFKQTLSADTVKVGLNYRFGGPVVARY